MTLAPGGRIETTRERILAILRRQDGVGIEELASEIGLAGATVRRHLDVLLRDGHVAVEQVRGRTGRPRYVFSLTDLGAQQFPHHYVRLTHRFLEEIVSLDAGETEGKDGRALAGLLFDRMADRLVAEYGPRIRGSDLVERARTAAGMLADEGIAFEVSVRADGAVDMVGRGCPCARIERDERDSGAGCEHDRRLLERLIGATALVIESPEARRHALRGYRLVEGAVSQRLDGLASPPLA